MRWAAVVRGLHLRLESVEDTLAQRRIGPERERRGAR